MAAITTTDIQNWLAANPGLSDAQIASAMDQYGVSPAQVAAATGISPQVIQDRYTAKSTAIPTPTTSTATATPKTQAPVISYTPAPDSEGGQQSGSYAINGKGVNPIYGASTYIGGGMDNPEYTPAQVTGYSGGIEHIGDQDYTAQYDASGNLLGYRPYAGESFFSSTVKPLLPIIVSAIAPGLGEAIAGATGLTGAGLSAATGATIGGGTAALTGQDVLKGAIAGGAGGYLSSSGLNTDIGMNSQLTPAAIDAGLGTPGYGYNASAASSGLFTPAVIGSNAYTQTSYPYDMADFAAADALQLQSQVGNNLPAIEQNLVASGVDPLVAADIANTVALNPNISQYDLTNYINTNFGGSNIYDVNTATQYPTSTLPGEGGLLTSVPGYVAPSTTSTTPTTPTTGLTNSQISSLLKIALTLAGTGAASGALLGNKQTVGALPTQTVPTNSLDYYNAIQNYYNTYLPNNPKDVVTPLQNWYSSKYGA